MKSVTLYITRNIGMVDDKFRVGKQTGPLSRSSTVSAHIKMGPKKKAKIKAYVEPGRAKPAKGWKRTFLNFVNESYRSSGFDGHSGFWFCYEEFEEVFKLNGLAGKPVTLFYKQVN